MSALLEKFEAKQARVGIVGLGYVGIPLAITFARSGVKCLGFDVDADKIAALAGGESCIKHIPNSHITEIVNRGLFEATSDFERVAECDALLLCVPTPLSRNREPDMRFVIAAAKSIAPHLGKGQLVILESTTYPGTTEGLLREVLEESSGLVGGRDFFLAYSPEREDPGNKNFDTKRIPKVVGAKLPEVRQAAAALYRAALDEVVEVSSPETAEMTKIFENVFRSVNIALVNELKTLCHQMDVDVWEVIRAASTKPFGFMPFFPGPGLGGHCIPIDPFYLTWKAREYGLSTRFIELAGEINTAMPNYVVGRTMEALNDHGKALKGARVLVLGVAYKKNVDDMRESPALAVIERLEAMGAEVVYHDPYIPELDDAHSGLRKSGVPLSDEEITNADAVLVLTDHDDIDYIRVADTASLFVDTRNVIREHVGRENVVQA